MKKELEQEYVMQIIDMQKLTTNIMKDYDKNIYFDHNFYVSSGKIKIRSQENSKSVKITHVEDCRKYFPDVDVTPSF